MRKIKLAFLGLVFIQNIKAQEVKNNKMINDSSVVKKSIMNSDSVHQLNQVVVSSKKPLYEIKIDRTVVNVDASPSNVGANVIEVLEKAPGVNVDKDGNISLKGKNAVLVMIDGRPSYLSPADLFNYLKSLPATSIDQIELMTNPPAKYDASGNAGVINIKTKKTKIMGFNGTYNSSFGQGVYNRNSNSLNMNYRKNKINIFSNMSYSNWEGFNKLNIIRKYKDENNIVKAVFDQNSYAKNEQNNNLNLKIGLDYSVSNKTNIGIVLSGFSNPESSKNNNISLLKNASYNVDSIVNSENNIKNNWENISSNIYLQHKFDSLGKELSIDIDASRFKSNSESVLINKMLNANNILRSSEELFGNFPIDIKIASIKTDYTRPLKNKAKFEFGAKSSYVETTNEANFFNIFPTGKTIDYNKTNSFNYTENINAAYLNYNKEINKWGIQIGLRAENTNAKGYQKGNAIRTDSSFVRNYTNLFPTSYITYSANEKNQYSINFGRRIDRPSYQDLNPFIFYLDNFTYNKGNPFLQPQISNNFELGYTYNQFITTTINYSITDKIFQESMIQDGFATIVQTNNIGTKTNYGISTNIQYEAKKIFSSNVYFAYTHDNYKGEVAGDKLDLSADMYLISVNNQFKFNKGWSAELSGWYRTKGIEGQLLINPLSQTSMAVQKQVLKNKGTFKLGVRDIFLTNFPSGIIRFSKTEASFSNRRDSRIFSLSFTYRFGKSFKAITKKSSGSDDEKSRIKVGNN
jgi:hypothetical protein